MLELIRSGDAKVVTAQLLDLGQKKGDQASFQAVHGHMHPQKHLKKKGTWKSVITNVSMCGCVQTSAANTPGRDGRGDLWCVGVAVSFIERDTRGSGVAHKVLLTFILRNKAEAAKQTQKPPAGKEGW